MYLRTEKDNYPIEDLEVDIMQVCPNPWNPNRQTQQVFEKLKKTLREVGFVQPVLVRKKKDDYSPIQLYEIIDGYHRYEACKELGWKKIRIWAMLDDIDDQTAKMLTLIMNNTRGEDDIMKRAKLLTEINSGQLQLLPFDKKEIDFEQKLLEFDFSKFERVKIDEKEKDPLSKVRYLIHQTRILLDEVYDHSNNTELRMFIEDFRQLDNVFRDITKDL